jgi:hypothetical protein
MCPAALSRPEPILEEGDKTIGISTDAGDLDVYASFLTPGHEYDSLENVLLIDEWCGDDRNCWLYTGLTRAKERITIARKGDPP